MTQEEAIRQLKNQKEKIYQEASEISALWVNDMIRLADKYGKDRNAFLSKQSQILALSINLSDFNNYKTKEDKSICKFAKECQDEGIDPQDIKLATEAIKTMRKGEKVLCQKEI